MSVARDYFEHLRIGRVDDFRAANYLADHIAARDKALGIDPYPVQAQGGTQPRVDAPPVAQWTVTAANGHHYVSIVDANPTLDPTTPYVVQHELQVGANANFDSSASVQTFRLALGALHLDFVFPNVAAYWRIRSRYMGGKWNTWNVYTQALNAGVLKTS